MATEQRRPTNFTDNEGIWNNETQAYNGDSTNYADAGTPNADPSITFDTWQAAGYSYSALTLYVILETTNSGGDDQVGFYYTPDNGSNWYALDTPSSTTLGYHEWTKTTFSITLSPSQDLSLFQVKAVGNKVKGGDGASFYIYDIYTEGTYTEPRTLDIDAVLNKTGLTKNPDLDALISKLGLAETADLDALLQTTRFVGGDFTLVDNFETTSGGLGITSAIPSRGQALTLPGGTHYITKCSFKLSTTKEPTGYAHAKIYNVTGTVGTDAVPTGSPIAVSGRFPVAIITSTSTWYDFIFPEPVSVSGDIAIVLEWTDAYYSPNFTSAVNAGGGHSGNGVYYGSGSWSPNAIDTCFRLYEDGPARLHALLQQSQVIDETDLVDSYETTDSGGALNDVSDAIGQAFNWDGGPIYGLGFGLWKVGTVSGNITFNIYTTTGTLGTNAEPYEAIGSPLATTEPLDVSTLDTTNGTMYRLNFATPKWLPEGTYCISANWGAGDAGNYVVVSLDSTSPTHYGNYFYYAHASSQWVGGSAYDCCYWVYGPKAPELDAIIYKTGTLTPQADAIIQKAIASSLSLDAILYEAGGAVTKTVDLDALLKKTLTKTPDIDALLQKGYTLQASIDALMAKQFSKEISIDALLKAILIRTVDLDALLIKEQQFTTSLDALLQAIGASTVDLDALLQAIQTKEISIDVLITAVGNTKEASLDALLQALGVSVNVGLDSLLTSAGITVETALDAVLESATYSLLTVGYWQDTYWARSYWADDYWQDYALTAKTLSIDALLQEAGIEATVSIDALLQKAYTKTLQLDALLKGTYSADVSIDALLQKALTASADLDALLQITQTKDVSIDALLQKTLELDTSLDALLTKALEQSLSLDSLLQRTVPVNVSIDAILALLSTATVSLDAVMIKQYAKTVSLDAVLASGPVIDTNLDALLIKLGLEDALSIDALLSRLGITTSLSIDALLQEAGITRQAVLDAVLSGQYSKTISIDALITKANNIATISLDALATKAQTISTSLDAILESIVFPTIAIDAILYKSLMQSINMDAVLQKNNLQIAPYIDALLQKTNSITTAMDAILLGASEKGISLDAVLQQIGATSSISIDALLYTGYVKSASLDSIVYKTLSKSVSLDSVVQGVATKTTLIDAIIYSALIEATSRYVFQADSMPTFTFMSGFSFQAGSKPTFSA